MTIKTKFKALKKLDMQNSFVSLAVVKDYKRQRVAHYNVKYVQINDKLEKRLRNILIKQIDCANNIEEYTYDCPEPEDDLLRTIKSDSTDFYQIMKILETMNPEEDIIESLDELVKAKSYLIILRNDDAIQVVGFKIIPENWKMKKGKGLIPLLYRENRFEDLEDENIFSISKFVDFIYFDELLYILSKKAFEVGLNFREGMMAKAENLYDEVEELNLFTNLDILKNRVGNNQRYLRKIATIKNLEYYKDQIFLQRLKKLSEQKKWGIEFQNEQIVVTDETLDVILTVLQNKRLHSELTEEDFDVESAKNVIANKAIEANSIS